MVGDKQEEYMSSISEDGKHGAVPNSKQLLEFIAGYVLGAISTKNVSSKSAMTKNNLGREGFIIAYICSLS